MTNEDVRTATVTLWCRCARSRRHLGVIVRSVAFANMEAWLHSVVKSLTGGVE
jgi:hypothetical protein